MDDQLEAGEGGKRRYSAAELADAARDMVALVREFNKNPDPEYLTDEIAAILNGGDPRAVTMVCLGFTRQMMLEIARLAGQLAEAGGDRDLAARIEQDPSAYIETVLQGLQARYRDDEIQGGAG